MAHAAERTGGDDRSYATLQDVARKAGVSLATASRVLRGTSQVRPELRERVVAAASELHYTPNAHAQALASASSTSVGVICHDVSDPYFAAVAGGVMTTAHENGMLVALANTFRDPSHELEYVALLRAQRARAILLMGSGFEDRAWEQTLAAELETYQRTGGRVAVLSRHRSVKADTVLPQNREGAADLGRALLDLGHREFAVLAGPRELTTVVDRLAGFTDALTEAGAALPESRIVCDAFTREGGYAAATELLRRGTLPTCVFAVTDVMAIGALAAFRDHGVDVPGDVSLAGFDDIPIAGDLSPALTTVALPLTEMGRSVMGLALREPARRSRIERVAGKVVLRASTSPPAHSRSS